MTETLFERAKRRYKEAKNADFKSQRDRMLEDLKFSNPADPQQWTQLAKDQRGENRPSLVFDQTNQYIAQVVNDARQNKPSIKPIPVDSKGDIQVAEALEGIIRHIEYVSRAGIAYDTAIEHACRVGVGYIRIMTKILRPDTNEQEILIKRIPDPLSVIMDPTSTEPDGSDAMYCYVESSMGKDDYKREYPDAVIEDFGDAGSGWYAGDNQVRICEYFEVVENDVKRLTIRDPMGNIEDVSEDEYQEATESTGFAPLIEREYRATERKVLWCKMSGAAILEQKEFPSQYIPVVPTIGYELFVEGKRYLCGMVRRMMDAQRAYNYERTAYIEAVALQPKAPFIGPAEAIAGYQNLWETANRLNLSILPYNHVDNDGNLIPAPARSQPPILPNAFVEGGQLALNDIQASIGMYRANLGAPSNETSGKAINARKMEGDTANFHYQDNQNRCIEQVGRVVIDMAPRVYDTQRICRILHIDGKHDFVEINPDQPEAYIKHDDGRISINPKIGAYDVRVIAGPSYTTQRQEASDGLSMVLQKAPALLPVLGPIWAKMQDWPEADKVSQALMTMAPPAVQQIFNGSKEDPIPPHAMQLIQETKQHMDALLQENQQLQQALAEAEQQKQSVEESHEVDEEKNRIEWYKAETARLAALKPDGIQPDAIAQVVYQLMQQMQQTPGYVPESPQHEQQEMPPMVGDYPQPMPPTDGGYMNEADYGTS